MEIGGSRRMNEFAGQAFGVIQPRFDEQYAVTEFAQGRCRCCSGNTTARDNDVIWHRSNLYLLAAGRKVIFWKQAIGESIS